MIFTLWEENVKFTKKGTSLAMEKVEYFLQPC